ncbi:MAG TPA: glycosyltransferase family 39 protein [Micromonosporaceae bacterium]
MRTGPDGPVGWLAPTALTLAILLFQLDRAQPWRDELATWSAASRSLPDLLRMLGTIDAVSGPYYLFMHAWIAIFGDSVLALRLPSALAMTGTAGLVALLGRRLFGARTGLLAGLLFAVLPSTSRYGQEARPYAFATLFAVLATVLLVGALRRPTWPRWLGYALALVGLGLSHLVAITLVAGHAAAVLLAGRAAPRPRRWLVAVAITGVLLLPLVILGREQQARQLDWVDQPSLWNLPGLPGSVAQSGPVGGLLLGLAAVGMAGRGRWPAILGLSVLLPAALIFVGGLISPLWVPRYLVFTVPFGCLLAALPMTAPALPRTLLIVLLVAALGAPAHGELRRTHEWPRTRPIDYAAAARIIATNQRPGDGIVYGQRRSWRLLDVATAYHLRGSRPRDLLAVRDQAARGDLWVTECPRPAPCLARAERIWVLVSGERADPRDALPQPTAGPLRDGWRVQQVWRLPGLTLGLLSRPAAD